EDISGFGINLAGAVATGTVELSTAVSPRFFHSAGPARTLPTGTPTWLPHARREPELARFVRIDIAGDPSLCIGELRVLSASRTAPRAIGHDLSFAIQESAVGNTFTDRGRTALPEQILVDHGANFVRLRLWVDPPPGYSNLASVLQMARRAHAAGMRILL